MQCGWSGKILYIDLSGESFHVEDTESYKTFIGGRGINQWLLFKLTCKDMDPLAPEADFYRLITGEEPSPEELLTTGEKIQNIERAFNLLHAGFGRKDDMPPGKFVNIPVSDGKFKGEKIDPDKWNEMLDEY